MTEGQHVVDPLPADPPTYWQRTMRLTAGLFLAWLAVTISATVFARDLAFLVMGWPFSFWLGAQGALLAFLLIVWLYANRMERLDREFK